MFEQDQVQAARKAFGQRLRGLRLDANLNGRQLSARSAMRDSKISRIELGRQNPTENDIRVWCRACDAEDQVPELIAAHRQIDEMWEEYRQAMRAGLKQQSERIKPLYEQTKLIRAYEPQTVPGFLQRPGYTRAVIEDVSRSSSCYSPKPSTATPHEGCCNPGKFPSLGSGRVPTVWVMTFEQTVTESRAGGHEDDEVSDAMAEKRDQALAVIQRLLKARGVRSYVVHTVALKLFGDGRPYPLGQRRRLAPELAVTGSQEWHDATVSVGPRSGCYLVSLRGGSGLETVREPQRVVDLILTARSGGGA